MLCTRSLPVVLALVLAPIACKGGEADAGAKGEAAPAAAPAQQDEKAAEPAQPEPAPAEPTATSEGGESETGEPEPPPVALPESFETIGIAECDEYVAAHVACIEKMPEAEREAARRSVFDNLEAWKQTAAGGPSAEKGLTTACRIAREQAKRATQDLGCQW